MSCEHQYTTPMPETCVVYECEDAPLEADENGFMCCTSCGRSYGEVNGPIRLPDP
jgi:hypothetical protein